MSTQTQQLIEQVLSQQSSQMKYQLESQNVQNERLKALETKMDDLVLVIKGNGKAGLMDRFSIVEQNQVHCMDSRKGLKADWKWLVTGLLAIIAILREYIK